MRPITISLDATTWELAKKKTNFSAWVRDQLRSERNKGETPYKYCYACNFSMQTKSSWCPRKQCSEYMVAVLEELE